MTSNTNLSAYEIAEYQILINGRYKKRKFLEFKDPLDSSPERLFGRQVKRFKGVKVSSNQDEYETEIVGIKIHSFTKHIFYTLIAICTFGVIEKSLAMTLAGKKIYFNLPDYEHWRRLNGNTLYSYGVVKRAFMHRKTIARREEIKSIYHLLVTLKKNRPPKKLAIDNAKTPFKIAKAALDWADRRLDQVVDRFQQQQKELREKIRYQMAAYYILISAKIERDCGGVYLQIGENIIRQDKGISHSELNRILNTDYSALSSSEVSVKMRYLFIKTRKANLVLNKEVDFFNSIRNTTSPIASKLLLEELSYNNPHIYEILAKKILSPLRTKFPIPHDQESKLGKIFVEIEKMGVVLKEQFDGSDPDPAIGKALEFGFKEMLQNNAIKEEHQYGDAFKEAICLGAAWKILSHPSREKNTIVYQIDADHEIRIHLKNYLEVEDPSNIKDFSPLTGFLAEEKGSYTSAPSFRDLELLLEFVLQGYLEDIYILEVLIERKIQSLFTKSILKEQDLIASLLVDLRNPQNLEAINYKSIKVKRLEQYMDFDVFPYQLEELNLDPVSYERIVKAFQMIQSIGVLIQNRYYERFGNQFIAELNFDVEGNLVSTPVPLEKTRTEEEHQKLVKEFLPYLPIPLPPKEKPPCISKIDRLKIVKTEEILGILFHYICSTSPIGHCAVGACAQSILGLSNANSYKFLGVLGDPSKSLDVLMCIRNGVSKYLKMYPEKFYDYTDGSNIKFKKDAILRHANKICQMKVDENGWFELIDFVALGHIVGRPIYILNESIEINPFSREIKMIKILEDIYPSVRPIFLMKKLAHFDCLLPKRNGSFDLVADLNPS